MKKKIIALFFSAIMLSVMTSCGSGRSSDTAKQPAVKPQDISVEDVTEDVEAILSAALDYTVDNNEDADVMISNEIIRRTKYEILNVDGESCVIQVEYPDVSYAINELYNMYGDLPVSDLKYVLYDVFGFVKMDECPVISKTIEVQVVYGGGDEPEYSIVWTDELYNAFTGGLYNTELEG